MSKRDSKPIPMRGGPMMGPIQKARDFRGTLRQLAAYMRPYWTTLTLVLIFAVLSTVFSIVSPKILGEMTNRVVDDYIRMQVYDQVTEGMPEGVTLPPGTTGADVLAEAPPAMAAQIPEDRLDLIRGMDFAMRPQIDFDGIGRTALTLLALYLFSMLFGYIQGWMITGVSQQVTYRLRRDIAEKIGRMPLKYFDGHPHGDVISRVSNDVDTVNQTLNQGISSFITSLTMVVGILVMMLSISPLMTLVAILTLPLSFGLVGLVMGKSQPFFKSQQESLGALNGHIEEMYGGHTVMKAFNGEARSVAKFAKINGALYESAWKSQFLSGLLWPIVAFVSNLGFVGVSVLGGYLAVNGRVNIGDIQAFIQYTRQFNQPIMQLASIAAVIQSTVAAAERVFEFLAEAEQIPDSVEAKSLPAVRGAVEFDNVVFGYAADKPVIKGFSANIQPGQRIAIVGPTGAGKTTLVNLLMRFYDVDSGSIRLDGVDIRDLKRADLRRQFGMVLQDTWLFHGSLRDNIRYGNPNASEDAVVEAAKAAHADHYIHSLPGGYDMEINEEADNISQGEKQLLTIARAMLADPPMLILDEATSSVDTRTEVLIQQAMDRLMHGRTSFVIAHRLSTIRDADLILVMNDGNIVEQGTHEALLSNQGFYADLYESQFK
jgi:ATP-binding cassette subfamily B protein